jgi:hypothetical protein
VLIISARNSLDDMLKGLNIGADDYLTKPFHLAELKARLMAVYCRKALNTNNKLLFNEIEIDVLCRTVAVNMKILKDAAEKNSAFPSLSCWPSSRAGLNTPPRFRYQISLSWLIQPGVDLLTLVNYFRFTAFLIVSGLGF